MAQVTAFPLSSRNAKRAIGLLVVYGILVIASALAYMTVSGDRSLPIHFIFLLTIISVGAWGIHLRYRWAWALMVLLTAWQIYSGLSTVWLNAGAIYAPPPAKIVIGFVAVRTLVLIVLFLLLLFVSDQEKIHT